jgi:hypothetical protein
LCIDLHISATPQTGLRLDNVFLVGHGLGSFNSWLFAGKVSHLITQKGRRKGQNQVLVLYIYLLSDQHAFYSTHSTPLPPFSFTEWRMDGCLHVGIISWALLQYPNRLSGLVLVGSSTIMKEDESATKELHGLVAGKGDTFTHADAQTFQSSIVYNVSAYTKYAYGE